MKALLSPKDLALAIGVSESSLKRWADDGLLHVTRTAGGHRKIAIQDAIRFVRESRTPIVRADMLGMPELMAADVGNGDASTADDDLFRALTNGEVTRSCGLIIGPYTAGRSVAWIFDQIIRKAMQRVGEVWKHDDKGIFIEHRATDICLGAINALRSLLQSPARDESADHLPVAVGGAPTGDPYLIPSLMSAVTLADAGFKNVNLGPETPIETLQKAVETLGPRLAWLSVSVTRIAPKVRDEIDALAPWLDAKSIPLIVGGRGVETLNLTPRPNLHTAESMSMLAAFALGLRASIK